MEPTHLDNVVLALLFASDEPLSARKLSAIVDDVETSEIRACIDRLGERVLMTSPCIKLESVAGGWQLSTNPEYADYIARLYSGRRKQRLSKAALETVAIIAYKQPVTRADIENIRGVSCGGVITTLMERTLIRITGKAKVLGAPFLYGTTQEFLEYLGINSVKDLPSMEELEALLEREESSQATDESAVALESNQIAAADDATADSDTTVIRGSGGASAELDEAVLAGAPFTSPEGSQPEQERDVEKRGDEETHEWEAGAAQDGPPAEAPPDESQTDR
jgi:segregation and condensation protein B